MMAGGRKRPGRARMSWETPWRAAYLHRVPWVDGQPTEQGGYPSGRVTYENDADFHEALLAFAGGPAVGQPPSWYEVTARRSYLAAAEAAGVPVPAGPEDEALAAYVGAVEKFCEAWGLDRFLPARGQFGPTLLHRWTCLRLRQGDAYRPAYFASFGVAGFEPGVATLTWDPLRETTAAAETRLRQWLPRRAVRAEITLAAEAAEAAGAAFADVVSNAARDLQWLYWRAALGLTFAEIAARAREGEEDGPAVEERVRKAVQRMARRVGIDDRGWYTRRG